MSFPTPCVFRLETWHSTRFTAPSELDGIHVSDLPWVNTEFCSTQRAWFQPDYLPAAFRDPDKLLATKLVEQHEVYKKGLAFVKAMRQQQLDTNALLTLDNMLTGSQKDALLPHQKVFFTPVGPFKNAFENGVSCADFSGMGEGKTAVTLALASFSVLSTRRQSAVISVPAGNIAMWQRKFDKWERTMKIRKWRILLSKRLNFCENLRQKRKAGVVILMSHNDLVSCVDQLMKEKLLKSADVVSERMKVTIHQKKLQKAKEIVLNTNLSFVAIDEAHIPFNNPRTARLLQAIKDFNNKLFFHLMTGTPFRNESTYLDLMKMLRPYLFQNPNPEIEARMRTRMLQFTRCHESLNWDLFAKDLKTRLHMRDAFIRTRSGIKESGGRLVVLAVEVAQTPQQVKLASAEVKKILLKKIQKQKKANSRENRREDGQPEERESSKLDDLPPKELLAEYGGEVSVAARAKLHGINLHPCLAQPERLRSPMISDSDSMKLCLLGRLVRLKRLEYQNLPIGQQGTTGKMLIMSQFIPPLEFLEKGLPRSTGIRNVFLLSSSRTRTSRARQAILDKFEEQGEFSILLSTIGVGAVGFDIMAATTIVILEPTWDPTWLDQAFFRPFRHGQEHLVECYVLISGILEKRMMQYSTRKRVGERILVDNSDTCVQYLAQDLQKTKTVLRNIIHQHVEFDRVYRDMWTHCQLPEEGAYKITLYDQLVRDVLTEHPALEELIPEEKRWSEDIVPNGDRTVVVEEEEEGERDRKGGDYVINFG